MSNGNNNTLFVEANVIKFLHFFSFTPIAASEEMIFEYFCVCKFSLSVAMATIKLGSLYKIIRLVEDYSGNISVKLLSKYLQWDNNKGQL